MATLNAVMWTRRLVFDHYRDILSLQRQQTVILWVHPLILAENFLIW